MLPTCQAVPQTHASHHSHAGPSEQGVPFTDGDREAPEAAHVAQGHGVMTRGSEIREKSPEPQTLVLCSVPSDAGEAEPGGPVLVVLLPTRRPPSSHSCASEWGPGG